MKIKMDFAALFFMILKKFCYKKMILKNFTFKVLIFLYLFTAWSLWVLAEFCGSLLDQCLAWCGSVWFFTSYYLLSLIGLNRKCMANIILHAYLLIPMFGAVIIWMCVYLFYFNGKCIYFLIQNHLIYRKIGVVLIVSPQFGLWSQIAFI